MPTGDGATWLICTAAPTVVSSAEICSAIAATLASSHKATSRGVESTGTSPDRWAIAVSDSVTTRVAIPVRPGSTGIQVR